MITPVPEQDKFENLDEDSRISVDGLTGLAQRLDSKGKPTGDAKPLKELLDVKDPEPEEPPLMSRPPKADEKPKAAEKVKGEPAKERKLP